jgi:hypothetical protein
MLVSVREKHGVTIYRHPYRQPARARGYCVEVPDPEALASARRIHRLEQRRDELFAKILALEGKRTGDSRLKFLPRGVHFIRPSHACFDPLGDRAIELLINEESARQVEAQRMSIFCSGHLPFFSIGHDSEVPAFYPSKFFWVDDTLQGGVYCSGSFTNIGRQFFERGRPTYFSPVLAYNFAFRPHRVANAGWDLGSVMGGFLPGPGAFREKLRLR